MVSGGRNSDLNSSESPSPSGASASDTEAGTEAGLTSKPSSDGGESALGKAVRDVAPYLDLGWRLAGTTAGPPGVGFAIDLWLQTIPWFLFGGCVVGLAGAVLQLKRL